jgi:16S rRNA (uracil1498-N3)-methyltransferase
MTLFYIEKSDNSLQFLPPEESKHAVKVLRLSEGDSIAITNGIGDIFTAKIVFAHQKNCEIKVLETQHFDQPKHRIHMAVAPTKLNDRYEWMVEKMTEMGVDEITPIICEHSERKILKTDRLHRICISAVKQSWKAYAPIINEPVKFADFVQRTDFDQKMIAHCQGGCGSDVHLKNIAKRESNIVVMIGPEGDFSENEVNTAEAHHWTKVGLGSARLRTETAGLAACFTLNIINEPNL